MLPSAATCPPPSALPAWICLKHGQAQQPHQQPGRRGAATQRQSRSHVEAPGPPAIALSLSIALAIALSCSSWILISGPEAAQARSSRQAAAAARGGGRPGRRDSLCQQRGKRRRRDRAAPGVGCGVVCGVCATGGGGTGVREACRAAQSSREVLAAAAPGRGPRRRLVSLPLTPHLAWPPSCIPPAPMLHALAPRPPAMDSWRLCSCCCGARTPVCLSACSVLAPLHRTPCC